MRTYWWLLLSLLAVGCSKSEPLTEDKGPVSVWVAASASGTVDDLDDDFENQTGIDVEVVPGPSSGLAKQIVEGAKADLFLPADKEMADYLAEKGLVADRRNLLTNHLVVITNWDSPIKITQLSDLTNKQVRRIALAESKVPAGMYARQALKKADVLEAVEKKSIGGMDVLATLKYVALKEADAGIVYWSDTLGNTKVQVAYDIPDKMHEPIVYPLVLLKQGANRASVRKFYDFLSSPKAADKFRTAGFGTVDNGEMLYYKQ